MSRQFRENWKKLVNKNADKYGIGDDGDLVRFDDQGLLTASATGLGGLPVTGTPASGRSA